MATEFVRAITDNSRDSISLNVLRNPKLWYVTSMMIVCSTLYYLDVILDFVGMANPSWSVFLITHDLHLFLFSIPLLYAAYVFRVRGIIVTGTILMLIFIPRAIISAPYLEPLFRAVLFTFFIATLSILIAYVQDRRLQIVEAYTIVKQHEEKLMIAETAIKTCVSAIATANLNGDLTFVNPAFLKIWGYKNSEEALGKNLALFCKEEGEVQGLIQTLLIKRDTEAVELVGKKKDGIEFLIGLRASLIMDAEGQPIGITASMADITEREKRKSERR